MRKFLATIGATLAIIGVSATSAAFIPSDGTTSEARGGGKAFVGPVDDAFFVDL